MISLALSVFWRVSIAPGGPINLRSVERFATFVRIRRQSCLLQAFAVCRVEARNSMITKKFSATIEGSLGKMSSQKICAIAT
jgi:hypothetical protein